jgi:hypothetical protein
MCIILHLMSFLHIIDADPPSLLGLLDLLVKDLRFSELNWLFETLMVSLVI